jgi:hypothetical protein
MRTIPTPLLVAAYYVVFSPLGHAVNRRHDVLERRWDRERRSYFRFTHGPSTVRRRSTLAGTPPQLRLHF